MSGQQQLFTINGLVDTNKNVWKNLESLAAASAAFVTWDPYTAQYGVVINEPGVSTRSFNDDNIIGAINVTETPFDELYNSAEVTFPNRDIRDKLDSIRYEQPVADRFDNEPDNKLNIQYDFVNDPIQADVIARTELKQARVNKSISFTTDFTNLDVAPGDVIDVTIDYWGWDQKLFRVVELTQTDTAEGQLLIDVVAIEYDAEVYNYNNLSRYSRTLDVGNLVPVENNAPAQANKDETTGSQFSRAMTDADFYANTIQPAFAAQNYSTFDQDDIPIAKSFWETYLDTVWAGEGQPPTGTNQTFPIYVTVGQSTDNASLPKGKLLKVMQQQPYGTGMYYITSGGNNRAQRALGYFPLHWTLRHYASNQWDWTNPNPQPLPGASSTVLRAHDPVFNDAEIHFEVENPLPGGYELRWSAGAYAYEQIGFDLANEPNLGFNITYQTGSPGSYTNTTIAVQDSAIIQFVGTNYTGCGVSTPGAGVLGYGTVGEWSLFLN
jgi:hypothetical protein